ncbi:MAG TPA: helix-turn-helix domain-containing protein [Longimicrobium sp.]|jgi:putative transcriptional regulator|nr:helix-turn-helix domain-containing protein [Longimicrobium sp.]
MAGKKARVDMNERNDDAIEVTDANFGELLVQSLEEALAIERGEAEAPRRVRRVATVRDAKVQPPRGYDARAVQRIRERLGLSQAVFARVLNSSPETVKAWEQGKRTPDGIALALLQVADEHPQALLSRVRTQERKRA